jgi:hypothetical protein
VEFGAEIGQIFPVSRGFALLPIHFLQTPGKMECHFGLRRVERERGIPGPAIRTIEAATLGARVGEGGIHDVRVRDSENKFMDGDAGQQIGFPQQPFVGCAIELKQILQLLPVGGEPRQHAGAVFAVARRDEAMSIVLMKLREARRH